MVWEERHAVEDKCRGGQMPWRTNGADGQRKSTGAAYISARL